MNNYKPAYEGSIIPGPEDGAFAGSAKNADQFPELLDDEVPPTPVAASPLVEALRPAPVLDVPAATSPAVEHEDPATAPAQIHKDPVVVPRSLAVQGVQDNRSQPMRVSMQQAINSWSVSSGVLKMIILHPGYSSSLDDKLAGIEVTRHALDEVAEVVIKRLQLPNYEGSRQRVKRHFLPVMESVWAYMFAQESPNHNITEVVDFASKMFTASADMLSADPDELFLRSDRGLDFALARFSALTKLRIEIQPIFDVIDRYVKKNPSIGKLFFGEMDRQDVVDDIFQMVETRATGFLDGIDMSQYNDRDKGIVNRVVLRQCMALMTGILRSDDVMAKLSAFAKEAPKRQGILKEWLNSQFEEWTNGMPSLASQVLHHMAEQERAQPKKGPIL